MQVKAEFWSIYRNRDCRNIESDFKKMIEQKNDI